MSNKLAIVALSYLENAYADTLTCLKNQPYPVFFADRDGVGSMTRAFNDAFIRHIKGNFEYVWFVTNINFAPHFPDVIIQELDKGFAAVQPCMVGDHGHLKPLKSGGTREVPFIEFTAPAFRVDVFEKFLLDQNLWYYFFDLVISKQLRDSWYKMGVIDTIQMGHTYLRNGKKEQITLIRERLRFWRDPIDRLYMDKEYGPNWEFDLWKKFI
jgi:hypothetical protein